MVGFQFHMYLNPNDIMHIDEGLSTVDINHSCGVFSMLKCFVITTHYCTKVSNFKFGGI